MKDFYYNQHCKNKPKNQGQRWTLEEENELLTELSSNLTLDTIAKNHERTIKGIQERCKHIAFQMFLNNVSIGNVQRVTKISDDTVFGLLQKKNEMDFVSKEEFEFSKEKEIEFLKELLLQKDEQIQILKELIHCYRN
jgi:hypothetical protein